ncbi:MAG TPA: hydroxymethylglutaryl-CoA lyase [Thermomicrobiales bacterium]|nr:hydroxymethylglutaryl-CoA lyase [Thermomicrobiales bacterium]
MTGSNVAAPLAGLPARVRVVEVGPRDGLQNERGQIATADKIAYIDLLSAAGFPVVEATSFVSPRAVPQLADAAEVMAGIARRPGTEYLVLVPNQRGYERALAAGARAIAVFTSATETFARKNINATIAESLANFRPIVAAARREGVRVRGYISMAFGCPFEGDVAPAAVLDVAQRLLDLGVDEVSVGDTIGVATPRGVADVLGLLLRRIPAERLAAHFHDTRGTALANVLLALQLGVATFDAASGGLGGCPFAPGAAGNLATEDLLYLLHGLGIATGVDLDQVVVASRFILAQLGRAPASKYLQACAA